jgi:NTP pyrophosphatase (non-canonical NTP hydrolase)
MKLTNEFQPIRTWAFEKGIISKGDSKTQLIKLQEECGELARAVLKDNHEELIDAIGDCVVVLTNLAALNRLDIEECINSAYDVIKSRTGKMNNGTFIKD